MNRPNRFCLGLALGLLSITAFAAGNPEQGKAKAMYCATCHGGAGERKLPMWQGGKEAINAVVKDLLANGMADARLQPRLSRMDGARCERQLTDLLCEATGGPCKYVGRDMKTAHAGANVTETEWQAFAENLNKTYDRFNVPARERGELMRLTGPMKADIVGH